MPKELNKHITIMKRDISATKRTKWSSRAEQYTISNEKFTG